MLHWVLDQPGLNCSGLFVSVCVNLHCISLLIQWGKEHSDITPGLVMKAMSVMCYTVSIETHKLFELWVSVHRQHLTCYSLCGKKGSFFCANSYFLTECNRSISFLKMRKPWKSQTSVWEISLSHFTFHIRTVPLAHPKMKRLSLFRHPLLGTLISNPCDFCSFSYRQVNSGTGAQHDSCLTWKQSSLVPARHVWPNMFTIYKWIKINKSIN